MCVATSGPPAAGHSACAGDQACAGTCDGVNTDACGAPKDASQSCGSPSCQAGIAHVGSCNPSNGACAIADTACDPYVCDGSGVACKSACTSNTDCKVGFVCTAGQCVAPVSAGVCNTDNTKSTPVGGSEIDCAPYACRGGACLSTCTSSSDCQGDNVCNGAQCTSLAALSAPASADKGGCGCRVAGGGMGEHGSALFGLGALGLAALARRRRLSAA
jgi:MYXO-CTERM domain-containing protein